MKYGDGNGNDSGGSGGIPDKIRRRGVVGGIVTAGDYVHARLVDGVVEEEI